MKTKCSSHYGLEDFVCSGLGTLLSLLGRYELEESTCKEGPPLMMGMSLL